MEPVVYKKKAMYKSAKKDKNFSDLQPLKQKIIFAKKGLLEIIYIDITSKLKNRRTRCQSDNSNLSNHFVKKQQQCDHN